MIQPRQTILHANALLFSALFHEGQFTIPWHQRYYDWSTSHVLDLLSDLDEAIREDRPCYFLGSIMLVQTHPNHWEINDGQQRMITISLLCAALCKRFANDTLDTQREAHALRMLFDLDATGVWSMTDAELYTPRINPPVNDQMRYKQMIRGNSIGTNGKLTTAWSIIDNFLGHTNTGNRWENFFDFIRERLEVACLRVPSNLDPNAIYETINSRGKSLDDLDRIRNFIYSHFNAQSETQRKTSIHDNLERLGTAFPNPQKATAYLRCRLQCHFGFLRSDNFYRDVRQAVREQRGRGAAPPASPPDYAFALTKEIVTLEDIALFRALTATTPDPDFVHAFQSSSRTVNSPRSIATFLSELKAYSVTQPIVFALMSKYVRETDGRRKRGVARIVNKSLSQLTTFVMRTAFVAPKFESSHFETEFSNMAMKITSNNTIDIDDFSNFLLECDRTSFSILNDKRFFDIITQATMTGSTKIKKFLLGINRYQRPDALIINDAQCTVEHILPTSSEHNQHWTAFNNLGADDWTHRIGNLTLMSRSDNKPGSKYNSSFSKKQESYRDSSVAITRDLYQYDDWTPTAIEHRQAEMARTAVQVWTFK